MPSPFDIIGTLYRHKAHSVTNPKRAQRYLIWIIKWLGAAPD